MYLAPWENSGSSYYNDYNQKFGQWDSHFKKMIQLNTNKHWKEQNFKYNEMVFNCYKSIHCFQDVWHRQQYITF